MAKFISEVLPVSGITVSATLSEGEFELSLCGESFYLTRSDINRLHGIAFPEKFHGCCDNARSFADNNDDSPSIDSFETDNYFSDQL